MHALDPSCIHLECIVEFHRYAASSALCEDKGNGVRDFSLDGEAFRLTASLFSLLFTVRHGSVPCMT